MQTAHTGYCAKTVQFIMILSNSRFTFSNVGGQRCALATQNTKFRVGKLKSRGGKVKKKRRCRADPILAHPLRKRAGAPVPNDPELQSYYDVINCLISFIIQ